MSNSISSTHHFGQIDLTKHNEEVPKGTIPGEMVSGREIAARLEEWRTTNVNGSGGEIPKGETFGRLFHSLAIHSLKHVPAPDFGESVVKKAEVEVEAKKNGRLFHYEYLAPDPDGKTDADAIHQNMDLELIATEEQLVSKYSNFHRSLFNKGIYNDDINIYRAQTKLNAEAARSTKANRIHEKASEKLRDRKLAAEGNLASIQRAEKQRTISFLKEMQVLQKNRRGIVAVATELSRDVHQGRRKQGGTDYELAHLTTHMNNLRNNSRVVVTPVKSSSLPPIPSTLLSIPTGTSVRVSSPPAALGLELNNITNSVSSTTHTQGGSQSAVALPSSSHESRKGVEGTPGSPSGQASASGPRLKSRGRSLIPSVSDSALLRTDRGGSFGSGGAAELGVGGLIDTSHSPASSREGFVLGTASPQPALTPRSAVDKDIATIMARQEPEAALPGVSNLPSLPPSNHPRAAGVKECGAGNACPTVNSQIVPPRAFRQRLGPGTGIAYSLPFHVCMFVSVRSLISSRVGISHPVVET
jgi:hypothetical protein